MKLKIEYPKYLELLRKDRKESGVIRRSLPKSERHGNAIFRNIQYKELQRYLINQSLKLLNDENISSEELLNIPYYHVVFYTSSRVEYTLFV
mgnify:CR=1 FL=1